MVAEQFRPWRRPALTELAAPGPRYEDGRLVAALPITFTDKTGAALEPSAEFLLTGPQDVLGLEPSAIRTRKPTPGSIGAEKTTVAFVELADPDLAWRYSPHPNPPGGAAGLKPWLVLLVGETASEITLQGEQALVTADLLVAHDLSKSAAWAHVHDLADGTSISRILSPRELREHTDYTAILVPAYHVEDGKLMIENGQPKPAWPAPPVDMQLPYLDAWTFRTKDDPDDFKAIASRLKPLSSEENAELATRHFAEAQISAGPAGNSLLTLGGALTRPQPAASTPLPGAVATDVGKRARLSWAHKSPWILGLPRYDDPWTALPAQEPRPEELDGWRLQLHNDPRYRGLAGLGTWAATAWQEQISAGATLQAGALFTAAARIRHLALGLRSARSQWDRRIPGDPIGALAVLSPMLRRLPTEDGTAMDAIAFRTPTLVPALFSSAARRLLRPRGPIARAALPGATLLTNLFEAAATTCPPPPQPPRGQEEAPQLIAESSPDQITERAPDALQLAVRAIRDSDEQHGGPPPDAHRLGEDNTEGVITEIVNSAAPIIDLLGGSRPTDTCLPLPDPDGFAESVAGAIDPYADHPVIVDWVLGGISGLREPALAPPDLAPELDIPLWSFVRDNAPDWLLPGSADVREDRVLALATNPLFVDAFLIGANQQSLAELRRRNIPITAGWTPLRRFWQRIPAAGEDGLVATDIVSVLDIDTPPPPGSPRWSDTSRLGDDSHQRDPAGPMLVLLLHTELFREYPQTQVYLAPTVNNGWQDLPDVTKPENRVSPILNGDLTPELVFFGFPLAPSAITDHWLVLEEPPPGYRFQTPNAADAQLTDGAQYAHDTLYEPVRAFFGDIL